MVHGVNALTPRPNRASRTVCYNLVMNKYKTVEEFLSDQSSERLAEINTLRKLILDSEPKLLENIKWNAPNYTYENEDRITFNVMNKQGKLKVLIHMGATKKEDNKGKPILADDHGLVNWNSDIRGTISFDGIEDIHSKAEPFKKVIAGWLTLEV